MNGPRPPCTQYCVVKGNLNLTSRPPRYSGLASFGPCLPLVARVQTTPPTTWMPLLYSTLTFILCIVSSDSRPSEKNGPCSLHPWPLPTSQHVKYPQIGQANGRKLVGWDNSQWHSSRRAADHRHMQFLPGPIYAGGCVKSG